jgi:hypothetical protein
MLKTITLPCFDFVAYYKLQACIYMSRWITKEYMPSIYCKRIYSEHGKKMNINHGHHVGYNYNAILYFIVRLTNVMGSMVSSFF